MRIWPDATTGDWSIGLGHAIVREMGESEFRIQASALPVTAETVDTITESVSVTVLVPPSTLIPLELEAPRDAIAPSMVFALRYFMRDGARRAIVRCSEARPWPGMRDIIVGRLLAEPVPAPERIAPRRSIAVRLSGSVVQCVNLRPGTPVAIQVTDISESGVGFVSPAPFSDGDRVMLDCARLLGVGRRGAGDRPPRPGASLALRGPLRGRGGRPRLRRRARQGRARRSADDAGAHGGRGSGRCTDAWHGHAARRVGVSSTKAYFGQRARPVTVAGDRAKRAKNRLMSSRRVAVALFGWCHYPTSGATRRNRSCWPPPAVAARSSGGLVVRS